MELNITQKEIDNFQVRIREDPIWFSEKVLRTPLWEKEKEILKSVMENKETSVKSCNSSGKTFTAARAVHQWLLAWKDSVVITTAPTGRQVREVLWREIKGAQEGRGIYNPDSILEVKISLGPKWFALGLSTDKPDQFQGFHSEHLLVVVDEASGVNDLIFEAIDGLTPTRILLIGNLLRNTGRFAKSFKDKNVHKITISAFDTPNVIAGKVVIPGLITAEDVQGFKDKYGEDSDVWRVRVLGKGPRAESESWIPLGDVEDAMNRELEPEKFLTKVIAVDTARFGDDTTVIQPRRGDQFGKKVRLYKADTEQIVKEVVKIIIEKKVIAKNVKVDVIGTNGLAVIKGLKAQGYEVTEVNFAEKADDPKQYANLRAECYGYLKEGIKKGSLPKDEDYNELANVRYSYNRNGQLLMEAKKEMKSRGLPSCDVADACAISYAPIRTKKMYITEQIGGVKPFFPEMGV